MKKADTLCDIATGIADTASNAFDMIGTPRVFPFSSSIPLLAAVIFKVETLVKVDVEVVRIAKRT